MLRILRCATVASALLLAACSGEAEAPGVRIERTGHAVLGDGQVAVGGLVRAEEPARDITIEVSIDGRTHTDTLPYCVPGADCWWATSFIADGDTDRVDIRIGDVGGPYAGSGRIRELRVRRASSGRVAISAPREEGTVYVLGFTGGDLRFGLFYFARKAEAAPTRLPIEQAERVRAYFYPGRVNGTAD